jgi:hypothetical protein
MVLGKTHPHLVASSGEGYRNSLKKLADELGVEDHVRFVDRFVDLDELCCYLSAADLYVTPYTNPRQITSGTLAYAMATGNAIVSTPYWYAEEMLADGRGVLIPFEDSEAAAGAINELLADDVRRHAMRRLAYDFSRNMVWPRVAQDYLRVFESARADRRQRPQASCSMHSTAWRIAITATAPTMSPARWWSQRPATAPPTTSHRSTSASCGTPMTTSRDASATS